AALDLPDEYRKPIDDLMGKVNSAGLDKGLIDIPKLDVPGIHLPDIDLGNLEIPEMGNVDFSTADLSKKLDGLSDAGLPGKELGELSGKAGEYQETLQDLGNVKEINDLPQGLEQQVERVD